MISAFLIVVARTLSGEKADRNRKYRSARRVQQVFVKSSEQGNMENSKRSKVHINHVDCAFNPSQTFFMSYHNYPNNLTHLTIMCRTYQAHFRACGHDDDDFNKTFRCANYPQCGPAKKVVPHRNYTFCSSCLQNARLVPSISEDFQRIRTYLSRVDNFREYFIPQARRLFDLAAGPGLRYNPVQINGRVLFNGAEEPIYDSFNIHQFSGRLDDSDGSALSHVEYLLGFYILDPSLPDLTANQYRLFRQIRAAAIGWSMTDKKHRLQRGESELIRRLNAILTPVPVLQAQDDPDCPICREPLGQRTEDVEDGEEAVKLPCGHIFGRGCIRTWISGWIPGNAFPVCPMCRANSDLLTPWERFAGVGAGRVVEEDAEPPAGWWIHLL
jgi:hypothetical protein